MQIMKRFSSSAVVIPLFLIISSIMTYLFVVQPIPIPTDASGLFCDIKSPVCVFVESEIGIYVQYVIHYIFVSIYLSIFRKERGIDGLFFVMLSIIVYDFIFLVMALSFRYFNIQPHQYVIGIAMLFSRAVQAAHILYATDCCKSSRLIAGSAIAVILMLSGVAFHASYAFLTQY